MAQVTEPPISFTEFEELLKAIAKGKSKQLRVELFNFIDNANNVYISEYRQKCVDFFQNLEVETGISTSWLGYCYFNSIGTKRDIEKAFEYCERASSEFDDPWGHYALGFCLRFGWGVDQDRQKAVLLFKRAIQQDAAPGYYGLGECYEMGHGVEVNLDLAIHNYQLGADRNFKWAVAGLGMCYTNGKGVPQDQEKGTLLLKSHTENRLIEEWESFKKQRKLKREQLLLLMCVFYKSDHPILSKKYLPKDMFSQLLTSCELTDF